MDYNIRETPLFVIKFSKIIPLNKQKDVRSRIKKLQNNPYTGKPLGYKYLRELKLDKFRIYYIVSDKDIIILLITVSDKKQQKETIKFIKNNMNIFQEMIKNLNNNK